MKKKPALFNGHWTDLEGKPIRRVTRMEMRELWRLWAKHRDIRSSPVPAAPPAGAESTSPAEKTPR